MAEEQHATSVHQELTTQIVAAYVRRNQVAPVDVAALIVNVYEVLGRLGGPPVEPVVERTPAVPIRRSITPSAVVCLDCGWRGQVIRRHLMTAHGLSVDQYRARWKLPADHAMTAPAYSERRSAMAKRLGLGQSRTPSAETLAIPEKEPEPSPKRRGRARTSTASTETA